MPGWVAYDVFLFFTFIVNKPLFISGLLLDLMSVNAYTKLK